MTSLSETQEYLESWKSYVTKQEALKSELTKRQKNLEAELTQTETDLAVTIEARDLFIAATGATQDQVRVYIEELVTLALQSVFGEAYAFRLKMQAKRGQAEMEPVILWQGEELSPRSDVGGGVVDVASFALRLILWTLSEPRSAPVFLLDEPFKFLSKDKTEAAASMLKGLVSLLGIQIFMVSHDEGLIAAADKAWLIKRGDTGSAEVTEETLSTTASEIAT